MSDLKPEPTDVPPDHCEANPFWGHRYCPRCSMCEDCEGCECDEWDETADEA